SKRACGYARDNMRSVAVVTRWMAEKSKHVPGGAPMPIVSSVTVSGWASPSMSGQYSSSEGAAGAAELRTTGRLNVRERRSFTSGESLETEPLPSGKSMRTAGKLRPGDG